jgi:hypothetical protein
VPSISPSVNTRATCAASPRVKAQYKEPLFSPCEFKRPRMPGQTSTSLSGPSVSLIYTPPALPTISYRCHRSFTINQGSDREPPPRFRPPQPAKRARNKLQLRSIASRYTPATCPFVPPISQYLRQRVRSFTPHPSYQKESYYLKVLNKIYL